MGNNKPGNLRKVLFCYIDGFDIRSVNNEHTPFLSNAFKSFPYVAIKSPPSADGLPTLLTGTFPNQHGMWGVKLKSGPIVSNIVDKLPHTLTTTAQCIVQFITGSFDLPCIPPSRRRRFKALRTQHNRYYQLTENLLTIGGLTTCLGAVGIYQSRYLFHRSNKKSDYLISKLASGKYLLEIFQMYNIDLVQRWNIDKPDKLKKLFMQVDDFINRLYRKCQDKNIKLILFSDHGYDRVIKNIDINRELKKIGVKENDYSHFVELSMSRFWFHTNEARSKIMKMLEGMEHAELLTLNDLNKYNLVFPDKQYGEVFLLTHPGYVFFPHDFYNTIANLYIGLSDSRQRPRIYDPVHRGDHSFIPEYESSSGYLLVLDEKFRTDLSEANLTDVAPTILDMLEITKPETMMGNSIFHK